ncbi:patatin-like phospholipase family protein [Robertkochia solimangrovi]|uniref:patatin-like phospholipase family protein n=1 Tax=Robertkochia solimangrovi TaxID=2213046 RepID=UPI00117E3B2E|nr:patatin-like phospholipase family protein [Robertkochia solimangrovi]TRZ42036.1 phospholipase [Robertkochia solimangrovi]
MDLTHFDRKQISLVLSGGGIKGMAHIGIIRALNEFEIVPKSISGVSAGALVGALYAKGLAHDEMITFFKETPLFNYKLMTINKPGFFDSDKYMNFLLEYFPENRFAALEKKLYITTTNLELGIPAYFDSGELLLPLVASAALPPVFSPVLIDEHLHADGGIMNNFPSEPVYDNGSFLIGSYTSAMGVVNAGSIKNSIQVSQRANLLLIHANSMDKLMKVDLLFRPEGLDQIGILDKKGIDKAYLLGYEYACKKIEKLLVS